MTDQTQNGSAVNEAAPSNRSAAENIRELTAAGKQLLDAGKQMTDNLNELSERVEHATSVGSNILTNPWTFIGAALGVGLLLVLTSGED